MVEIQQPPIFLRGGVATCIDKIGDGIDFAIIDTAHSLPGEALDFLVILPYLKNDAVVCLHDVAFQQYFYDAPEGHATGLLFAAVSGEKYLNFVPAELNPTDEYPNIVAFKVNNETRNNIADVFAALMLRWHYLPDEKELKSYKECLAKHYDKTLLRIFDNALRLNKNSFSVMNIGDKLPFGAKVLLYSACIYGRKVYNALMHTARHVVITKWVDKNYKELAKEQDYSQEERILDALYHDAFDSQTKNKVFPITSPDDINKELFDYAVVAVTNPTAQRAITEFLIGKGVKEDCILLLKYYRE